MQKRALRRPQTLSAAWVACCFLALCASLANACGGRSASDGSGVGSPGSSGAPDSSHAGASRGGAGTVGTSGAPAAGASASGASGDGASGAPDMCGVVECPNIGCPVNTAPVVQPGACCPICQSTCKPACVPCPVDTHPVMVAGACCPSCESSLPPPLSCESGKMMYAASRAQMLDKYSHGCATDQDCVAMAPSNRCEPGCAYAALLGIEVDNFNSNLKSDADNECVNCPMQPFPECGPPIPVCLGGACTLPVK
jgi:hypothetical protein